jgi:hypothetical protein
MKFFHIDSQFGQLRLSRFKFLFILYRLRLGLLEAHLASLLLIDVLVREGFGGFNDNLLLVRSGNWGELFCL